MQPRLIKAIFFSSVLLSSFFNQVYSQSPPADALKKLFNEYPQEKIYLWYNKAEYVAGETIWFKGYVFSGYEIFDLSTTLYVELYNAEKKIIDTRLFPIYNGSAQGSIDLSSKLDEGIYYVRAYTSWMLNFNEAFQYIHPVTVFNPASSKHLELKSDHWELSAFPEGGNLIHGIETKVAVRILSQAVLSDNWNGYLYDESNPSIKIKEFTSLDKNVGLFSFIPEAGKHYKVFAADDKGNTKHCSLPDVKDSGVGFSIENVGDSITYKLSFQNIPDNAKDYSILGQMQQQTVYYAKYKTTTPQISLKMPVMTSNNGILHLTIFNPLNEPVAERLVFLNHAGLFFDSFAIDQFNPSNEPKAKNEITVAIDSLYWTSFAVSVTDAETSSPLKNENILSSVWLTSDLKNPVQSPASYFINPNTKKKEALDAILISEKWNRFSWSDILNNKFPEIKYSPGFYLSYTGTVKKGVKLKPDDEVNLMLTFPDSSSHIMVAQIDTSRNIHLSNLAFSGDLEICYQLNNKKNNARSIQIDLVRNNQFVPYSLPLPESPNNLITPKEKMPNPEWVNRSLNTLKLEKSIEDRYKTLEEITLRSSKTTAKDQLNEKLSSPLFQSMSETVFDFINEQQTAAGSTNILNWLQGRVAGLSIQMNNSGVLEPYIRGSLVSVVVDEMVVQPDYLSSISIADIAMIKVIKGFVPGLPMGGGGGVVAIYTARGNLRPQQTGFGLPNTRIKGYDDVKKVFQPNYADKTKPQDIADTRDQLLWQSLLSPGNTVDKSDITFYNNDNTKKFRVIIQGYLNNGTLVYIEKIEGSAPDQK